MSWSLGEEHQPASDHVSDFGCLQRDRLQREVPWWIVSWHARSTGILAPGPRAASERAAARRSVGWDHGSHR